MYFISVLQQRFGDFPTFSGKRFGDFRFSLYFCTTISITLYTPNPFHQIKPYLFINFLIIVWRIHIFIVILRHYGLIVIVNMKWLNAMSEKELEIFRNKVRAGLLEAERNMLHEKAARGETCVYQDDNGRIYHVAAKDVIAANPRFQ